MISFFLFYSGGLIATAGVVMSGARHDPDINFTDKVYAVLACIGWPIFIFHMLSSNPEEEANDS